MTEPDFNLLIALDVLLSEGSVAGAARRLGLSASAMSRTLGRLRAVTGDALLVRAGRNMVLTPHAEHIRERTRQAAFEVRSVLNPSAARLEVATLEKTFTLRTNEGFVEAFGADLITTVAAMAPGVCLSFVSRPEKDPRHLREGLVDIEIGVVKNMGPEIVTQALFRDRFIGVMRRREQSEQPVDMTAPFYAACKHVITSRHGNTKGPVDDALATLGLTRKIAAVVPNFAAALAVARQSDLLALVPASFFHHQLLGEGDTSTLVAFELPVSTPEITVSQMWHPRQSMEPAHQWLRQVILEVCRQKTAGGLPRFTASP